MCNILFETLHDRGTNALLYEKYTNMGLSPVYQIDDIEVYATDSMVFAYDNDMGQISTIIGFSVTNHPLVGNCISDAGVWDNIISHEPGLLKKMLFEYVLPKYEVLICDSVDIWYCKRFWLNRVPESFDNGTFLYVIDIANDELVPILNLESWYTIYYKNSNQFWGDNVKYQIVISNRAL